MNLGQVVMRAVNGDRWAQLGGTILPAEQRRLSWRRGPHHATLMPNTGHARQQFDRHGVQYLIANHHPLQGGGQFTYPVHGVGEWRQCCLLACTQALRQLNDVIARQRPAKPGHFFQHVQRQCTRAGPKLPYLSRAGHLQGLLHLPGQRATKQRRHLRCRHKVAAGGADAVLANIGQWTKFAAVIGVIAQARRVQGQRHEPIKANPARRVTGHGHGLRNMVRQSAR